MTTPVTPAGVLPRRPDWGWRITREGAPMGVALAHLHERRGVDVQHEHTEHVAAPPDALYAAISNVSNLPRFVPQITAATSSAGDRIEIDARYEGRVRRAATTAG